MQDSVYSGLEPQGLWKHFAGISRTVRPSGREEQVTRYVQAWADRLGYVVAMDDARNVCVHVPARDGRDDAPVIVLQSHLDMVCERNSDSPYDAERGHIHAVREGEWIRAVGTTLGADNGIGVAAMLHVAEDPGVVHGPLDLLFTVSEETGLIGAQALDPGMLRGRILLNLDNERDGELCVGCAGSRDVTITMPHRRVQIPYGWLAVRVSIGGLRGGHSGMDIDRLRLNAIRGLARLLRPAAEGHGLLLSTFEGGRARNAIPREALAVVFLPPGSEADVRSVIDEQVGVLREQFAGAEDDLHVTTVDVGRDEVRACTADDTLRLLDLLLTLPCGVLAMSAAVPGVVETSNSIGTIATDGNEFRIGCLARSSLDPAMADVVDTFRSAARLAGAEVSVVSGYPGWQPDPASPVLAIARGAFRRVFDDEPVISAVHAGLECGVIGARVPGMDMVAFGPDIDGPHAPGERVHIGSVENFWKLLVTILEDQSVTRWDQGSS
jgi:dipeptidase D